jgi:anthranilate synthase component 1
LSGLIFFIEVMKKSLIRTSCKRLLADVYTPVGIYLRLRDRFRDTILLESTDHHAAENSWSFICVNAIGGIEVTSKNSIEYKVPGQKPERVEITDSFTVLQHLSGYMQRFEIVKGNDREEKFAQGLFGYSAYDAIQFFDTIRLSGEPIIPLIRYRLYQYVIAFNHFKDELFICENHIGGLESEMSLLESIIRSKDVPVYPFRKKGEEISNMTGEAYMEMVRKGVASCYRGDVFQIVLSRRFEQEFSGDEFNVYRSLRSINPSPYLFYFDYGDYKLMGSSPEAQLVIANNKAVVHPIAGTFKRTGNDEVDKRETERLLKDAKENAEHVMLVDLARNDLSRVCDDVVVAHFKEVQYYSHVIHLVSEVIGKTRDGHNPFELLARTFPAGTLSGAPKFRAMELINSFEPIPRSYYGGAIGFVGFDGSCNHAIMIRTFLSRNNTLVCQAGAGIVAASDPESELQEVNYKLAALKKAIELAEKI